ncbi:hypothetical protein D3C85_1484790 [compost metagenome]
MLHQSIEQLHTQASVLGQVGRLGHPDNVVPTEAGQALGRQFRAERAGHQGPDEGKQQTDGAGEVGIGEAQKVRVVNALEADKR